MYGQHISASRPLSKAKVMMCGIGAYTGGNCLQTSSARFTTYLLQISCILLSLRRLVLALFTTAERILDMFAWW